MFLLKNGLKLRIPQGKGMFRKMVRISSPEIVLRKHPINVFLVKKVFYLDTKITT